MINALVVNSIVSQPQVHCTQNCAAGGTQLRGDPCWLPTIIEFGPPFAGVAPLAENGQGCPNLTPSQKAGRKDTCSLDPEATDRLEILVVCPEIKVANSISTPSGKIPVHTSASIKKGFCPLVWQFTLGIFIGINYLFVPFYYFSGVLL